MSLYKKPESIITETGYCPGCGHGVIQRLIGESIEELNLENDTIAVVDIACAYWSVDSFNFDAIAGPHGRCAAVATGIKRVRPDKNVYIHAGDGASYVIGLAETCYAAMRNESITMIVVNNGTFGMTGGQMNPATTLIGDSTLSSKKGRSQELTGKPYDMLNLIKNFDVELVARGSVHDVRSINQSKKLIKKAFENQKNNKGFSIVEILSACPTNWKMTPVDSMKKIKDEYQEVFPLGIYVDKGGAK